MNSDAKTLLLLSFLCFVCLSNASAAITKQATTLQPTNTTMPQMQNTTMTSTSSNQNLQVAPTTLAANPLPLPVQNVSVTSASTSGQDSQIPQSASLIGIKQSADGWAYQACLNKQAGQSDKENYCKCELGYEHDAVKCKRYLETRI